MADRGRDLSFDLRTDTSKFDLSEPASELDDLGTAAKDAAQDIDKTTDELKRLAAQGKDAQRALDELNREAASEKFDQMGKDAKAAAAKVDSAFDSVARSAKTNFDKVDKEIKEAGDEGFKDLKEEAGQSGREAAQSFSGQFSDITGFVQETAAQAFAGFGPLGAAAGVAAALGIGLITKAFGDASEAAAQAKARIADWTSAIIDAQGKVTNDVVQQKLRDLFASDENTDKLHDMREEARKAKVDFVDYALALSGSADAQARLVQQFRIQSGLLSQNTNLTGDNAAAATDQAIALQSVADRLGINNNEMGTGVRNANDYADAQSRMSTATDDTTTATDAQTKALADVAAQQEAARQATDAHRQALEDFTDPAQTFVDLLTQQGNKAKETGGKLKTAGQSIGDFIKTLGSQVRAQQQFAANLNTLVDRGFSQGFIASLEAKGPAAAQAIADLTHASPAEVARINRLWAAQADVNSKSWLDRLEAKKQDAAAKGKALNESVKSGMAQGGPAEVQVGLKGQQKTKEDARVTHEQVESALAQQVPQPVHLSGKEQTVRDGTATHEQVRAELSERVPIPTFVQPPPPIGSGSSANAAEHALSEAQAYAKAHPITIYATIVPLNKQP